MLIAKKIKRIKRIKRKTTKKKFTPTISKIEVLFGKWLTKLGIEWVDQFKLSTKYYDFKVKNIPLIIEFHGDYYHANPLIYEGKELNLMQQNNLLNDKKKKIIAEAKGYEILYIWECDFRKNKPAVKRAVLNAISKFSK